jgi:hypothetical protein
MINASAETFTPAMAVLIRPQRNVLTDQQRYFMRPGHDNAPFSRWVSSGNFFVVIKAPSR